MKITGVETVAYAYELERPIGDVHLPEGVRQGWDLAVFVHTDEGVTGTTIAAAGAAERIASLAPALVGRDPRHVRSLWHWMVGAAFKQGVAGPVKTAISAIDCALWDLRAKANGVPLYVELGGFTKPVAAYASGLDAPLSDDELSRYYRRMAARGVAAGKLKVGRDREADLRRLGVMRDALGGSGPGDGSVGPPKLMVDANEFWTPKQAVQRVREMEGAFELMWVEEPCGRHDAEGLRRVSDAIAAPVASGENLNVVQEFAALLRHGAVDVVQIGMYTSGITGAMQVAELACAFDRPVAMMNCPGRFMAHLAAALPHHTAMEVLDAGRDAALVSQPEISDGCIQLGDEPGSGIVFDEEKLARLRADGPSAPTLGSVYMRAPDAGGVG